MCAVTIYVHVSVHTQRGGQGWAPTDFGNHSLPYLLEQGFPLNLDLADLAKLGWPDIFLSPSPQQWNYSLLKVALSSGMPLNNIHRRVFDNPAFPSLGMSKHGRLTHMAVL